MEKKSATRLVGECIGGVLAILARCVVFCLVFRWLCL